MAAYLKHTRGHYVDKEGQPTSEQCCIRAALRPVKELYGHMRAVEFGPLALKAVQQKMIAANMARGTVNRQVHRVRRMFKWAVSEELVPTTVYQALLTVPALRRGKSAARETPPVPPVTDEIVDRTLPHLPTVVADMVRFQRLTGARPGEVCILRPMDIAMDDIVWTYRPSFHKTEHRGRMRIIMIGPQAQAVLRPYLLRNEASYCFSPQESERKRRRKLHEQRTTPLTCGNVPGSNVKRAPKRSSGQRYNKDSYNRAIARARDLAFPAPAPLGKRPGESRKSWLARLTDQERLQLKQWQTQHRWRPNQLRHAAATEIRKRFGLEAAQVTLGHATANVTQVYAERDLQMAAEIARQVG